MKIRKTLVVLLAILLSLSSSLFAQGAAEKNNEKIVIRFYWWGNQLRNDQTAEVIALYEETHPEIDIQAEFTDWSGYWDRLAAFTAGGNTPDIISMAYTYYNQYQENNILADLTPFIEDGTLDTTNIPQSVIDSGSTDGHCYAISAGSNALAMFYDKAVVETAGVEIPLQPTFDELYEIGEEIYEKTGVHTYFDGGINMMHIVSRTNGRQVFNELAEGDSSSMLEHFANVERFNSSEAAIPYELLSEKDPNIVELKPIIDGSTWNDFSWSNQAIAIENAAGRELGMCMYPTKEDAVQNPMYLMPSMFLSVAETSPNKKEAVEFVNWFLNSKEANEIMLGERGIPVNTEISAYLQDFVDENNAAVFEYVGEAAAVATAIDAPDPAASYQIEAIANTTTESLRAGEITVEEAAESFTERAEELLNE